MLASTRAGTFNFMNQIQGALSAHGIEAVYTSRDTAPEARSLWHMDFPVGLPGALLFRRTYHYPFWHIEAVPQRWRWPVAEARFDPDSVDASAAEAFVSRLAARVLPGPRPSRDGPALVALQGRLLDTRSFQTMSPIDMVRAVGRSGRPAVVALHPKERYSPVETAALEQVIDRHPLLTLAQGAAGHLREAAFVVTQNSAVAFDGLILGKPAVLFGQIDFHHIALNVADFGADGALDRARTHSPPTARYVDWFLRGQAIDAMSPDAQRQIAAALIRGGWQL